MERRIFIGGVLASGVGLLTAGQAKAKAPAPTEVKPRVAERAQRPERAACEDAEAVGAAPWELIHPLQAGDEVGLGWTVVDLSGVTSGAAVLTLTRDGVEERVHLCRRDGSPRGI